MTNNTPERPVSVAELRNRTGLSTSTIYAMMAAEPPLLERPGRVSPGRVGWSSSYIDVWLEGRLADRRPSPQQAAA